MRHVSYNAKRYRDITAATYVARSEGYELLKPHESALVHAGVSLADRGMD
ncbi:MAG TPA: hypothetical protein VJW17_01315 [Pyrinomonadaceae bacterium]|nr:hypothetical protein [Pyrinomonadaceae bacterium]